MATQASMMLTTLLVALCLAICTVAPAEANISPARKLAAAKPPTSPDKAMSDFKPIQNPSTLPNECLNHFYTVCDDPASGLCDYKGEISGPFDGCDEALGWCMLNTYRADNTDWEGIAWKHTDNYEDPECLWSWSLYDSAGEVTSSAIVGTTGSGRNQWCPLATSVIRADHAKWENKTWQRCT